MANGTSPLQRSGMSTYMAQAALDMRRARTVTSAQQAAQTSVAQEHAPVPAVQEQKSQSNKGFSFKLGKLGISFTEEPELDVHTLAEAALERFNRERSAAFNSEMEVARLREQIATPQSDETLPALQETKLARHSSLKAYSKTKNTTEETTRKGTLIGVY